MLYLNDHLQDLDLPSALAQLSEQRREQALRFTHEQGRRECCAAYLLLREALHAEYGITEPPLFTYSEHGKPALADHPEIFFNLSHCREAAICVVSNSPVGVDIERIRPLKDSLVSHTMNEQEQVLIAQASRPDIAFIQLWTRKEAILKLTGEGIHNNMRDVLTHCQQPITTVVSPDERYVYSVVRSVKCEVRNEK